MTYCNIKRSISGNDTHKHLKFGPSKGKWSLKTQLWVWWLTPVTQLLWRQRLWGLWFETNPGRKSDPISTNKLGMAAHFHNPSYEEGIGRRISVRGWPQAKKQETIWKISIVKKKEGKKKKQKEKKKGRNEGGKEEKKTQFWIDTQKETKLFS
jgi:hypothetical protein